MARTVGINPPKTPCTEETRGMAKATIPNICKMPGPPAPFVPAPLPNIGKSNLSPKDYSTTVKIEGHKVAIRGATFESIGDIASKGTGGGLISANTHGPTKFITPGSMNVKIEGKNVHTLSEPMLNNCGPSGSPPNTGATMMGLDTHEASGNFEVTVDCADKKANHKWDDCMCGQVCEMIKAYNESPHKKKKLDESPSTPGNDLKPDYDKSITDFNKEFNALVAKHKPNLDHPDIKSKFYSPGPPAPPDCQHAKWKAAAEKEGGSTEVTRSGPGAMNPDHMHPASLSGPLTTANLKWADQRVNSAVGGGMKKIETTPKTMTASESCNCPPPPAES